jgi:CubicO group peptidase (beta-lactamase class C family)
VPSWEFDVLAPAGGLRSTANDLAKFLTFASGPEPEGKGLKPLHRALKRAIEPGADSVPGNRVGLFWMTSHRKGVMWHNGMTGGFHAYVAFVPGEQLGVAVLSNTAVGGVMEDYGARLLLRLAGDTSVEPPAARTEVAIDPATLDDYVGDYALTPVFFLNVRRQGNGLTAQASRQPAFPIYPEGPDRFFYRAVDAQLRFERDAGGKVVAVHLSQNGANLRGPRMKSATRPAATRSGG